MFNKKTKIRKKENVFSKISKYLKKERRLSYKKTLIDHYKILAISISILFIARDLFEYINEKDLDFFDTPIFEHLLITFFALNSIVASIIFDLIIQTPNNLLMSILLKNIKNTAVRRSLFLLSSNIVIFVIDTYWKVFNLFDDDQNE